MFIFIRYVVGGMKLDEAVKDTVFNKLPAGSGGIVQLLAEHSISQLYANIILHYYYSSSFEL